MTMLERWNDFGCRLVLLAKGMFREWNEAIRMLLLRPNTFSCGRRCLVKQLLCDCVIKMKECKWNISQASGKYVYEPLSLRCVGNSVTCFITARAHTVTCQKSYHTGDVSASERKVLLSFLRCIKNPYQLFSFTFAAHLQPDNCQKVCANFHCMTNNFSADIVDVI